MANSISDAPSSYGDPWSIVASRSSHPVTEAILTRRSVREGFTGEPIPRHVLEEVLHCGLAAPSSKHAQPWRFHVVTNRSIMKEIADAMVVADGADTYVPRNPATGKPRPDWPSTVELSAGVLREAAAGIFVENYGVFSSGREVLASADRQNLVGSLIGYTFEIIGIGAAIQNLVLASHALGVQGVYMGDILIVEPLIKELLTFKLDLVGVLALGYSSRKVEPRIHDLDDPRRVVWHE